MLEARKKTKKVVFCVPTITKPYQVTLDSLAASAPLLENAGWDHNAVYEIGCPYISVARSQMLQKAMKADAEVVVFIDHDLSWDPEDLLILLETKGDVVAGTYRFKKEPEEYMGSLLSGEDKRPIAQAQTILLDGKDFIVPMVKAEMIPAGFLKITRDAVDRFMAFYPELCFGERICPHVDLFNHGAHNWTWYGEDYAFARRWRDKCGDIWIIPTLNITHWAGETPFPGNYDRYLRGLPGSSTPAAG